MNLNELICVWDDLKEESKQKYITKIVSYLKELPTESKGQLYLETHSIHTLFNQYLKEFIESNDDDKFIFVRNLSYLEDDDFFGTEGIPL